MLNVELKEIKKQHVRKNIGIVLQNPFLFSKTIYDNIAYAKPDATKEEVLLAARASGAHDFICKYG